MASGGEVNAIDTVVENEEGPVARRVVGCLVQVDTRDLRPVAAIGSIGCRDDTPALGEPQADGPGPRAFQTTDLSLCVKVRNEDALVLICGTITARLSPTDLIFNVDLSFVSLIVINRWGLPE